MSDRYTLSEIEARLVVDKYAGAPRAWGAAIGAATERLRALEVLDDHHALTPAGEVLARVLVKLAALTQHTPSFLED